MAFTVPQYLIKESIGRGAYAKVFKAVSRERPDEVVALKRIDVNQKNLSTGIPQYILREVAMLKKLNKLAHPNIVKLYDVIMTPDDLENPKSLSVCLVFEYLPRSLLHYVEYEPIITPEMCKHIIHQTLLGIEFLHVNGVMHRDIKPENLLLSRGGIVKIADFGLSKPGEVGTYLTTVTVTLWYRPPEIILGCDYNFSADIWSLGMVMCQLFKRVPLIQGTSEIEILTQIVSFLGLPEARIWPKSCSVTREQFSTAAGKKLRREMKIMCVHAYALLASMLEYDIDKRCNAVTALSMPYFSSDCNCGFLAIFPAPLEPIGSKNKKLVSNQMKKKLASGLAAVK